MATVDIVNWDKKKVGSVDLNSQVFEAPVKKDIMHQIVRWQLAARRQGTHATKTRSEVSGGGKKPFRQKGTGNARQGSNRSPLMPGGGITFGPQPRNYQFSVPKKVRQVGLKSALSHLMKEGKILVVEDMQSEKGKTKDLAQKLNSLGATKSVLVDTQENDLFKRASRNIPSVRYYPAEAVNVYDLLKYECLVVTPKSLEVIEKKCGVK